MFKLIGKKLKVWIDRYRFRSWIRSELQNQGEVNTWSHLR